MKTSNSLRRLAALFVAIVPAIAVSQAEAQTNACNRISDFAQRACYAEAVDDFWITAGNCYNAPGRAACVSDAREKLEATRTDCRVFRRGRDRVCSRLTENVTASGMYRPVFAAFVNPLDIGTTVAPNNYFPLSPGDTWDYVDGEESEKINVTVTTETKQIEDATCVTVRDIVTEDLTDDDFENAPVFGAQIESTDDWMAQDANGNIIYCGEISFNQEANAGDNPVLPAEVVDIEGSWKWGRDGALPGLLMQATPRSGAYYRTEFALGDAEDISRVARVRYTYGNDSRIDALIPDDEDVINVLALCGAGCVVTLDFTPLEPGVVEYKFYAPGIGMVLEVKPDDEEPEWVRLTSCTVSGVPCNL